MRYSPHLLLFGASALYPIVGGQFSPPRDGCDNDNFAVSPVSGAPWTHGEGNTYFCDTRWNDGLVICGIQTWANKYHQTGVKLKYSDGTWGPIHGTAMQEYETDNWTGDYSKNTLEWDCAAPLKDLRMISNWPGFSKYKDESVSDAVGGIRLSTPGGTDYNIHGDIGDFPGQTFDLGSGFLVGARGRAGAFLDTLEWRLLASPVESAEIKAVHFKKDLAALNKEPDKVREMDLTEIWFVNGAEHSEAPIKIEDSDEETVSMAITHSTSHQFGVSVGLTVSAELKVPFLTDGKIEASIDTSYTLTKTDSSELKTEHKKKLTWTFQTTLEPKSAMYCKAWTFKGRYEDDYTATVAITFKNGKQIEVEQDGKYVSVGWTEAVTRCDPMQFDQAPKDAKDVTPQSQGNGKMLKGRAIGSH